MNYRNFTISPGYPKGFIYSHDNYDGAPDAGPSIYNNVGNCMTVEECKEEIDQWHLDNTKVMIELTFEELLAVQLALGIAYKKAPYSYLKAAAKKVDAKLEEVQKDIDFERTYTTND